MDECMGRKWRATMRKERPKFQVATVQGGLTLYFDINIANTAVERSFPSYAPGNIHYRHT